MELIYYNNDDHSLDNKSKILISMHPVDRYIYFDALANSISTIDNCSVCFSAAPSDTSIVNFQNIDMVIIAVTEKYITWNNSGFVSEAMTAIQNHIPILPIMLEPGIINLFNTRCGEYHYIENLSTEFSEENLSQINAHISSIKNDRHLNTEKNKPKIFISYRKRDIKELKRLVKLIDEHPERDNITLWYDTNLIPGDNYSQEIINQLKTCDLFLMLVTPNILEANNYVMRVEYPLAQKQKKHILPIVLQKTNLTQLNELFPNLPKCITINQIGAIFSKVKA